MSLVAEVQGLRVEIGGRVIVDGVSLEAHAGKVTAVIGPSGSGKTTTGLALLGEYPQGATVEGTITTAGGAVGYVPQHPAAVLNPARRVGALLRDIAARRGGDRGEIRGRVEKALCLAQIPDPAAVLRRFPHQLSGGQQQRVVLAQALLLGARVIVADEPTTGQDVLTKQGIVAELAAVARQGIAVVLLSHDLDVVRELADEVVVMREGRVVDRGPTSSVLTDLPQEAPRAARTARPRGPVRLEAQDLTAKHRAARGTIDVLSDIGVSVAVGECLALVGRSGSGKTTLGRCLAGLHSAYDGTVLLDGTPLPRSLRSRTRAELAAVQYVFQDAKAAFDEHRPVLDQVARSAVRLRGADRHDARRAAAATLEELGLTASLAERRPGGLSGGELQRAALARALLAEPQVLICDEITSGLDPVTRHAILDVLARLRERTELTLVFITHDLAAAACLADRIAVLDAGRIVEEGPAPRLIDAPQHSFTRALLQAAAR
ncbi:MULTISPECIES: ATP-binding cassette domain-containing protein [unclassified Streptomyces]|uniref:ABC transporter ATP-binding protein n=1 Tax=unclassified Streptomyces TaxID=2593676 RepID=UPI000DC7EB48|nr:MULTISPECIES: ATP-binding cassette domain-containing protein [unclassified Streptomyces]AWZ08386.1 ABC transporter ATP-binding protein [Streptomyces sp. ICC4]AWZ16166.1 ABC transporter ATP-binding protein [Streptomyces sp. ICC1]